MGFLAPPSPDVELGSTEEEVVNYPGLVGACYERFVGVVMCEHCLLTLLSPPHSELYDSSLAGSLGLRRCWGVLAGAARLVVREYGFHLQPDFRRDQSKALVDACFCVYNYVPHYLVQSGEELALQPYEPVGLPVLLDRPGHWDLGDFYQLKNQPEFFSCRPSQEKGRVDDGTN